MSRRFRPVPQSQNGAVSSTHLLTLRFLSNRVMMKLIVMYIGFFVVVVYLIASGVIFRIQNSRGVNIDFFVRYRSSVMAISKSTTMPPTTKPVILTWRADNYTRRFFRPILKDSNGFVRFEGAKQAEFTFRKNPLYVPSKCLTSIQQRMASNSKGPTIYHPELHMLMNSKLLNKSEFSRLSRYYMPFGYRYNGRAVDVYKEVSATLRLFPGKSSIFEFSENKTRPECLSCAVVCNGGILNGSSKGEEIDKHHMVFRVNNAIRRNHERDVGNRTTHYFFFDRSLTSTDAKDAPKDKGMIYVFVPCRLNDYKYITSVIRGKDPKINASAEDVRILHPDFVRYTMKIWVDTNIKSFRPTTGTLMLQTALHSGCDQVSVYGMGYNAKYTLYYYDKKYRRFKMDPKSHDVKSELAMLKGLHRAGIITWYKRDIAEFDTEVVTFRNDSIKHGRSNSTLLHSGGG